VPDKCREGCSTKASWAASVPHSALGLLKPLHTQKKKEKNLVQLFITTVLSKMGYWLATYSNNIFITKNSQTLQHTNKKKSDNKVWQENNI
jgi:hypothetical protein